MSPDIEASIGDVVISAADAGAHTATIPVTLSRPATVVTKVGFALDCMSQDAIEDVTIKRKGTLTFQVGQRSKEITFKVSANISPEEQASIVQHITSKIAWVKALDVRGGRNDQRRRRLAPDESGVSGPGLPDREPADR